MSGGRGEPSGSARRVGLCSSCRHARVVENRRGSRFWLCRRSREDARYPKYPPLPVLACAGWERRVDDDTGDGGTT